MGKGKVLFDLDRGEGEVRDLEIKLRSLGSVVDRSLKGVTSLEDM